MISRLRAVLTATLIGFATLAEAQAPQFDSTTAAQLRWRYIGPVGNRVATATGVPGDPNVYYAGAASGGIWKTTDAGIHWTPIFDDKDVSSIGALAVAPSNPNIVWAGTGEPFIRSHISLGNGVYKSTDAGRTWTRMGLEASGRIGRFAIDPKNPDIVFAAAQGHSYGPQQERGIYKTTDGGRTWKRVLFVDQNTGGIDVVMHPTNPQTLFAAMWQLEMHTWGRESGGPGSGIFVSKDGGSNWTRLQGNGLPTRTLGKIGLAFAPSKPDRIYALIETGDGVPIHGQPTDNGELWRSDDGGATWKVVSYDRNLACRQPYYTRMAVSTDNPDETYFLCATFSRSLDGGVTNSAAGFGGGVAAEAAAARVPADSAALRVPATSTPGGDNHDMWIDPGNANRMIVANDPGVSISTTRGRTWLRVQLPIAQMYHVTVDNRIPYFVYGNKQDGPSYRGPSNSRSGNTIARSEWHGVDGGESGWATPDPVDPNIIWSTASGSGSRGGIVVRFDERTRQSQNVEVWPLSTGGHPAAEIPYRFIWDAPFLISPHDHNKVYIASQFVHTSSNGGRSWQIISPDLTRNDKSKQQISGGLTPDNIGVEYGGVVYALAESRLLPGLMWTGSNDGLVHVTRDGGRAWTNVTKNIPAILEWGSIRHIEPSRYDAGSAYLIVDGHQENNRDPWIYRTKNFGKTWKLIVTGIPKSPLSYAHIIREDPVRRGLLYAGTENALYVSFDDGDRWQPLQMNLPPAPVYGMVIQEHFNDLVIATYGRGFWILDDLSPLQKLTPAVTSSNVHLFAPRPVYRFRDIAGNYATTDDPTAGTNPPYGAAINYWLKAARADSGGTAPSIAILDAAGKAIRTFHGTGRKGLNRVYWNLRNDSTAVARLRTKPLYNAELRFDRDSTRSAPGLSRFSVLMPPGSYTVRLTVDGQTLSQPLEVRKDPNSSATDHDIRAANALLLDLQRDIEATAQMLNRIESARQQIQRLTSTPDVRAAADSLEQKLIAVERNIVDLRLSGRGQDEVRWPVMLGGRLNYLAGGVGASDFTPTAQQREVQQLLAKQVVSTRAELDRVLETDLVAFNRLLSARGIKPIE
ncbi:MAG: sialidase [Gemmatimonadaceae bacterium]